MATLSITRLYADGSVLFENDLDEIKSDIETFVNTTRLTGDNIQDAGITASSKFVENSVTGALIETSAVTTSKLAEGAVTGDIIVDGAITTAKFASTTLTGAKFATNAVTRKKLDTSTARFSSQAINSSTSSTSYGTAGSVTITASGNRKVLISLFPHTLNSAGNITLSRTLTTSTTTTVMAYLRLLRDATPIATWQLAYNARRDTETSTTHRWSFPASMFTAFDEPSAGSVTYTLEFRVANVSNSLNLTTRLVAMELT